MIKVYLQKIVYSTLLGRIEVPTLQYITKYIKGARAQKIGL